MMISHTCTPLEAIPLIYKKIVSEEFHPVQKIKGVVEFTTQIYMEAAIYYIYEVLPKPFIYVPIFNLSPTQHNRTAPIGEIAQPLLPPNEESTAQPLKYMTSMYTQITLSLDKIAQKLKYMTPMYTQITLSLDDIALKLTGNYLFKEADSALNTKDIIREVMFFYNQSSSKEDALSLGGITTSTCAIDDELYG